MIQDNEESIPNNEESIPNNEENIPNNEENILGTETEVLSAEICYNAALEEYRHTVERANKFENKIYILITFCGVYSAVILNVINDILLLSFPTNTSEIILVVICIIMFVFLCILYVFTLIELLNCLRSVKIIRFDPAYIFSKSLYNMNKRTTYMLITQKYINCIGSNDETYRKLYQRSDRITKCLICIVLISFCLKIILILI